MLKKIIITILIFSGPILRAQDLELANAFYLQGEYDKAVDIYKKVNFNKTESSIAHQNYLAALYKLKEYDTAEKFIKSQIKSNGYNIIYKAELADFYELTEKSELAAIEYQKVINNAVANEASIFELQNYFYQKHKYDKIVELFKSARVKFNDATKYEPFLARAYLFLGQKDKMLDELLNYGPRQKDYNYVEMAIQDNIKEDEEIQMLETILYEKIQQNPNETFYNEILIWHFTQKSDYARAFIQAKAIDKRLNLEGLKVFELAGLSFGNNDYKNAAKMYKYVFDLYPEGDLSIAARRWYIQSKEEIIKNTFPINIDEIKDILAQYQLMLNENGLNPKTIEALRNMALLNAFYLNDYDKAIEILNHAISLSSQNITFRDLCKLDLGDIYILKNESWESTLLYLQVEKSEKENNIGENAKLKNARLYYFNGDFELAKEVLDILKKATTREIANDAMQLSLLIDDNTGLDSTETALKEYAAIDLLIFQNKFQESIEGLAKLEKKYKTHSLADEILWLKANTELRINLIKEAVADLEIIVKDFKTDILADDALFMLAKITEENFADKAKAMELYRQLLKDFPGSVFCAQARVRFRELRGDFVN